MIALPAPGQVIALPPPDSETKSKNSQNPDQKTNETNETTDKNKKTDDSKNDKKEPRKRKNRNKNKGKTTGTTEGQTRDPLFGHLGVTSNKKRAINSLTGLTPAQVDIIASRLEIKNKEDCIKMADRKKQGLSEDLPENVAEIRRYIDDKEKELLKKSKEMVSMGRAEYEALQELGESAYKNPFLEDNSDDEQNEGKNNATNKRNGHAKQGDEDDMDDCPATPERKEGQEATLDSGVIGLKQDPRQDPNFPNDQIFDYEDTLPSIEALTLDQQIALDRAKKYAMEQSVRNVLMNQEAQAKEMASSDSHSNLMRQQALVYMCRVYIGSVYYEVREQHIRRAFSPFGPIKLVNMSLDPLTGKHKGFAFVEFELPEASQLAIEQMNGVLLCGRAIKIGRPTNMPQSMPIVEAIVRESQKSARIYVSSIHSDLTLDDIKSVFGAFGPIISLQLRPCAVTGNHAGYGFIEYETVQAANDAVQSMNLFDLGGNFLRVGKAMSPPEKDLMQGDAWKNPEELYVKKLQESANIGGVTPQVAVAAAKVTTQLMQLENVAKKEEAKKEESVKAELSKPKREGSKFGGKSELIAPVTSIVPTITAEQLNQASEPKDYGKDTEEGELRGQDERKIMMQKLEASKNADSRVLCLRNMITEPELDDDFEDEVKEECETNYGPVKDVLVYLEKQSEDEDAETIVKVFIEFSLAETAKMAKMKLDGRFFGGRQITAHFYNMGFYEVDDLSH